MVQLVLFNREEDATQWKTQQWMFKIIRSIAGSKSHVFTLLFLLVDGCVFWYIVCSSSDVVWFEMDKAWCEGGLFYIHVESIHLCVSG